MNCREKLKVVRLIHSVSVLINVGGVVGVVKGVRNLINEKHKGILHHRGKRGHRGKGIVLKLFSQCAALSALIALSALSALSGNKSMKSKR
jgi:hypothetical protein